MSYRQMHYNLDLSLRTLKENICFVSLEQVNIFGLLKVNRFHTYMILYLMQVLQYTYFSWYILRNMYVSKSFVGKSYTK